MKELLDNYGLYILIGLGILVVIVAIILIINSRKKPEVEENPSSIFDVNIEGVVDKDFNYGYSKEDTVVVKPEDLIKKEEPKVEENNTEEKKEV